MSKRAYRYKSLLIEAIDRFDNDKEGLAHYIMGLMEGYKYGVSEQ